VASYFPLEFSDHARQKMALRSVSKEEVFSIVRDPEIIHRSDGKHVLMRGNLSVALAQRSGRWCVVTVLLREQEQWGDDDARGRPR
jgi:hypothetical protein